MNKAISKISHLSFLSKLLCKPDKKKCNFHFILLFLILVLAYWQISFLQYSLKWDVIDVVFPFRFHFSECIQNGYFPFWNPYQQTGVPFYADLQAPSYYPELLWVSLISGYSISIMNVLFTLYLFIAAIGIYKLSYFLNKNHIASFSAGIVYPLSGYIVAHGQHFFLLIGAAWIPFVILYYLRLNKNRQLSDVFKCGISLFLMLSGGYQALSIITFYFLFLLLFYFIIKEIRNKKFGNVLSIIKYNAYLSLVTILLCLPLIISTLEVISSVERLETGVTLQKALSNGLSPGSLISFILPFSTVKNNALFGIDISLRNVYFGIIPLIFFVSALSKKRRILEYIFLIFGLIVFASAMGDHLPVREFMYKYIPFTNLYHTTPYVSIFGILVFVIISANFFAQLQEDNYKWEKEAQRFTFVILFLLVSALIFSCTKINFSDLSFLKKHSHFQDFLNSTTFYEHIFIQSAIQLLFCGAFLFVIKFYNKIKHPVRWILFIVTVDMVVSTQMNIFYTSADAIDKPLQMDKNLSLYPKGFPIPINDKLIYNDQHTLVPPFWRNTYIFSKQVGFNSFSSFELKNYSKLDDDNPNLRDAVLNNKLVYFSETIFPLSQFNDSLIKPELHSKNLFFADSVYNKLKEKKVSTNAGDNIQIKKFSPNRVVIETSTADDQYLTIIQSNYKGWAAFIDDTEVPIYSSNYNYKTILLPKGKHAVVFSFKNNAVLWSYIFSNLFFIGILLFFIVFTLKKRTGSIPTLILILSIIIFIPLIFLFMRLNSKDRDETTIQQIERKWDKRNSMIHVQEDYEIVNNNFKYDSTIVFSGQKSLVIDPGTEFSPAVEIIIDNKKIKKGTLRFSAKIYPKTQGNTIIVTQLLRNGEQIDWFGSKLEQYIETTNSWNKIEYLKNYYDLQLNDKLRVYIWNKGNISMNMDNVKINFYRF